MEKQLVAGASPQDPKQKALKLLRAIRDVVANTPPEKIDMAAYGFSYADDTCGCALHHAQRAGIKVDACSARDLRMTPAQFDRLFDCNPHDDPSYKVQVGEPAKRSFLRRIDRIIRQRSAY